MSAILANTKMKQINVETATKEQLVDFIRRMHPLLQREQERARELEGQVRGLQDFIQEKNAEIRELRQQSERLAEKSASDEETISTLIRQMEEMCTERVSSPGVPVSGTTLAPLEGTVERGKGKSSPSAETATGAYVPEMNPSLEKIGNSDVDHRSSGTPSLQKDRAGTAQELAGSRSAAAMGSNMEEVNSLKNKVRELMEVNAFYSAIVSQHDQEEKVRMSQALAGCNGHSDYDVADLRQEVERLQLCIANMDMQSEQLQKTVKTVESEKAALREENEALQRELVLLEAEVGEVAREYARARKLLAASAVRSPASLDRALGLGEDVPQARASSEPQEGFTRELLRVPAPMTDAYLQKPDDSAYHSFPGPASRVSPLADDERQRMIGLASPLAQTALSVSAAQSSSLLAFRSLRPIRVRNPDAQEKELLDRLRLYEAKLAQMEAFELDRQRSFDEMERNRAELFFSMNKHIERQRREIHRLRKLYEETSPKSFMMARPSRNNSVASSANREEEREGGRSRCRVSGSPVEPSLTAVPTSSQSLRIVDSVDELDDEEDTVAAWTTDRRSAVSHEHHRRQVASASSITFGLVDEFMWREQHERSRICMEAVEEESQLFLHMHCATVQLCACKLKAREAELLNESVALVGDVNVLQTRVVQLEAQLAGSGQAEEVVLSEVKESETVTMTAFDDKSSTEANVLHVATSLFEHKALLMVFMVLEAYTTVLEYHAKFIEGLQKGYSTVEQVSLAAAAATEECTDAGIQRDLEEVRMVLGAARRPLQLQWSLTKDATPPPCSKVSAPRSADDLLAESPAGTYPCDVEPGMVSASRAEKPIPYQVSAQTVSSSTSAQITSLPLPGSILCREEEPQHGVAHNVGHGSAIYMSPDIIPHEQTSLQSPRSTLSGTKSEEQYDKGDEDDGPKIASSALFDIETLGAVIEIPGKDAVPLPLSTPETHTDTSLRQDDLSRSRVHDTTATSFRVGTGSVYARSASSVSVKSIAAVLSEEKSAPAEVWGDAKRGIASSIDTDSLAAEQQHAHSAVAESVDLDGKGDGGVKNQNADVAEDESSVAYYDRTLNSASQLEITEGEEAEFLEQLNKEMAGGTLEMTAALVDCEDKRVAAPDDLYGHHVSGEECEVRCDEQQRSHNGVIIAGASAVENVLLSSSDRSGGQHGGRGDDSEDEGLDSSFLKDKIGVPTSLTGSSDRRSGGASVASSPLADGEGVSAQRPSTSPTSTTFSSSSLDAGTSPSGDDVQFERGLGGNQTAPKHPVSVEGPLPHPPPTSLDELFGGSAAIASPSLVHSSNRSPYRVSSTSPAFPPCIDRYTSPPPVFDSGTALRWAPSPNVIVEPYTQQISPRPESSASPSHYGGGGEDSKLSSDPKDVHLHNSSSSSSSPDDFEADFDPFA